MYTHDCLPWLINDGQHPMSESRTKPPIPAHGLIGATRPTGASGVGFPISSHWSTFNNLPCYRSAKDGHQVCHALDIY